MAITVSFTGSPAELLELFQNNGFLDALRKHSGVKEDPSSEATDFEEGKGTPYDEQTEPEEETSITHKASREQMLHAVQEYAVRMYNRYRESNPDLDIKDMCAQLLLHVTAGTATHTSMVGDMFIDSVVDAAVKDFIPSKYSYLLGR